MLRDWDNFYIMAATAGATFIGLLFVVVTLGASWSSAPARLGVDAFLTPTLVHFCAVLLLGMAMLVPFPSVWPVAIILGLCGPTGLAYQGRTAVIKRRQEFVSLRWGDWIPHAGFPALANVSLIAGAAGLIVGMPFAPYAIAGGVTLLLVAGVYGAWDITLWIVRHRDDT